MISLVKTNSTRINNLMRLIKALISGSNDVREVNECSPYGVDSNPIGGLNAYFSNTTINGQQIILGYTNKQQKAATGEFRVFSTDATGAFKFNVWLRADGTVLIGDSDTPASYVNFLTKYTELNAGLQSLATGINNNLTLIQTAITGLGGAYVAVPVSVNITAAKAEKIKTI